MRKVYGTNKGSSNHVRCYTTTRGARLAWQVAFLILALVGATFLNACGGSGGGSGSAAGTGGGTGGGDTNDVVASLSNYVMPAELSAVPPSEDSSTAASLRILARTLSRAYTDEGTDYDKAISRKFVEEHTLEQFDILEDVLTAINQTKYYEQLGQPAYQAMVTMVGEGEGGKEQKSLEAWVVEADIVDTEGEVVNPDDAVEGEDYDVRVRAWIQEDDELIKAQFIIEEEATQNADGSYADYGVWTLNVKFGNSVDDYFAASCEVGDDGESIIKLHELFTDEGPQEDMTAEVKAVMHRGATTGYGQVFYPDWEAMWGPNSGELTEIPTVTAKYAYNEDYLGIQEDEGAPVYKDRNNLVEMTHQYGVFEAETGDDLMRDKQFGFPIYFEETDGRKVRGYYGAWQGRHQLWMEMDGEVSLTSLAGTEVTKEDHHPDAEEQVYTIGQTFNGTLVKRSYADASLNDIRNIPVEIWVNQNYQLLYDGSVWKHCPDVDWSGETPSCRVTPVDFDATFGFETLMVAEGDTRKHVNIDGWDSSVGEYGENKQFVYLPAGDGYDAGFYQAEWTEGEFGMRLTPLMDGGLPVAINTANVNQLWVWVDGSLYVEWDGSGWVQKELVSFDQERWQPEFGTNDVEYKLPEGRELYINMNGASYVVRKVDGTTTVKLELQTAANPENADTLLPAGTELAEPWNEDGTTYTFVTDPNSDDFLMLVYATVPENAQDMDGNAIISGQVVTTGKWGLEAAIGDETVAFNWEYSENGWGSVTYLMDGADYVLLDDPVRFDPITIEHNGADKTLALQYDGWMMGMPDMYQDLSQNGWVMTEEISEKIINLEAGTRVVDSATGTAYVLKPLEVSQFLLPVEGVDASELPDLTAADDADLADIPGFVEHGMGDMPADTTVLYSEGIAVE